MPAFEILSTNHTSFTVSSLERALAFFRDGLGFTVTSRAPRDPATIERIVGVKGADIEVLAESRVAAGDSAADRVCRVAAEHDFTVGVRAG